MYTNINRLIPKKLELEYLLTNYDNLPIVLLTETFLKPSDNDVIFPSFSSYQIFRCDRSEEKTGGGVLAAVPNHIQAYSPSTSVHKSPEFEALWLDLFHGKQSLRIILIYRPPHGTEPGMPQMLLTYIETAMSHERPTVIFGDFNYPTINWASLTAVSYLGQNIFCDRMVEMGFQQIVLEPTRHNNILDLIFVSEPNLLQNVNIQTPLIKCEHNPISCVWLTQSPTVTNTKQRYNFARADYESFNIQLSQVNWTSVFLGVFDVNDLWTLFTEILQGLIERFVPLCHNRNPKRTRWPKAVLKLHRKQEHLHKQYKLTRNHDIYTQYLAAARTARAAKRNARAEFEQRILHSRDMGTFYRYVRSKLTCKSPVPSLVDEDGNLLLTDEQKVNQLNEYFTSVFTVDDGKLPRFDIDRINEPLPEIDFCSQIVFKYLEKQPLKLSAGPDCLPSMLFKKLSVPLAEPLAYIYQFSYVTGKLPDCWLKADVISIFKNKGSPSSPAGYRPISQTCIACKIMEGIISEQLTDYLTRNNVITQSQHGFVQKKSTVTQMLECLNDWTKALSENQVVDVIYLDLAKAFDSVSHPKLIFKLKMYGIEGHLLNWIQSFLANRQQRVYLNGTYSDWLPVTSGVIQGSRLGPLLFLIYINDLVKVIIDIIAKFFADDSKLYQIATQIVTRLFNFEPMKSNLKRVLDWMNDSQLNVALQKSAVLHLGNSNPRTVYEIDNVSIPPVESIKDLGIHITTDLKPHVHVNKIFSAAMATSNLIFKCFETKDKRFLMNLFKTYVRPKLEYGSQIWNPSYQLDITKIERVQRAFTKRIPGLFEIPYPQRLETLSLQTLEQRRKIADLVMVFKILHGIVNVKVEDFFKLAPSDHKTRGHPFKLFPSHSIKTVREHFFSIRTIKIWNSLPTYVVASTSLNSFKTNLKSYYTRQGGGVVAEHGPPLSFSGM